MDIKKLLKEKYSIPTQTIDFIEKYLKETNDEININGFSKVSNRAIFTTTNDKKIEYYHKGNNSHLTISNYNMIINCKRMGNDYQIKGISYQEDGTTYTMSYNSKLKYSNQNGFCTINYYDLDSSNQIIQNSKVIYSIDPFWQNNFAVYFDTPDEKLFSNSAERLGILPNDFHHITLPPDKNLAFITAMVSLEHANILFDWRDKRIFTKKLLHSYQ